MIKKFFNRGFSDEGFYTEVYEIYFLGILIYHNETVDSLTTKTALDAAQPHAFGFVPSDTEESANEE